MPRNEVLCLSPGGRSHLSKAARGWSKTSTGRGRDINTYSAVVPVAEASPAQTRKGFTATGVLPGPEGSQGAAPTGRS